jgi:hypothetical protein
MRSPSRLSEAVVKLYVGTVACGMTGHLRAPHQSDGGHGLDWVRDAVTNLSETGTVDPKSV